MDKFETFKEQILLKIGENIALAIELSDWMADNPELAYEESKSSRRMVEILEKNGFDVEYPFMETSTAFRGTMGNGEGPLVAILVEYDALPGLGHACGHNLHGSMSILAAIGLSEIMKEIEGTLWVVGTPAEEGSGAKTFMADSGLFDDVDLALMIHCGSDKSYAEYRCLAMDGYDFTFSGKTAHAAAAPWEGLNALNAVQFFVHSLDMLRQHVRPDTRIHGIVREGGKAPNIVPEMAVTRFEFRSPRRSYLNEIVEKVFDCARGAAMATGTEVSWEKFESSFDDLLPNRPAELLMEEVLCSLGVTISSSPGPAGSTDVGNVSHRCPAIQPVLSISDREIALHTRELEQATRSERGHKALQTGAEAIALAVLQTLLDKDLREKMRQEFLRMKQA